jgi:serine protease Do
MDRSQAVLRPFLSHPAILAVLAWIIALCPVGAARADDLGMNKSDLIRGLLPTVVNISVRKDEPAPPPVTADADAPAPPVTPGADIKSYVGSGFVIDPSGLIVTNYHVVEYAFEITVTFSDGSRLPAKMLSASRTADLAVLKVQSPHPLKAAHWGNSDKLQVGDQVFAAGDPFGIGLSVSAGIVSGLNRDIQNSPYDDLIQTDASINHGNSGGPLFDMQGDVVGVDSTIISPTTGSAGLGFAIPATTAQFVVGQLLKYGWVHPAWIGVKVQTVTREIADAKGLPRAEGAIVAWVIEDGPAKKAGLMIGDVILRWDNFVPTDERALLRDIAHTPVGQKVRLSVLRDGAERTLYVTTDAWPRNQWDKNDAPSPVERPKIVIPPDLGLGLAMLPEDAKAKFPPALDMKGVLVTNVAANSDPALKGMAGGDIILRVQDKPVATPDEVRAGIDAARTGKRDYVLMLVLPKKSDTPGPKWFALQLATAGG